MFENGVEVMTGIMVTQDIVDGSAAHSDKKYVGDESILPKKEPIMAHVAETLNTVWYCSTCGMPLRKYSRQRRCTCHEEHKYYNDDPLLGCCQGWDTFVLPKEYRLYEQGGSDLPYLPPDDNLFQSRDDDNGGNGEHEGEIKDDFYSSASSNSDDSTGNGGKQRAQPEAANKRQKRRSLVQVERRTQPRRTCKGTGADVGGGKV
jgi:hypothetical protein